MSFVLLLSACAGKPAAPSANPLASVRSIALMSVREPDQHILYNYVSPMTALGIVGHVTQELDLDAQGERFNAMLAEQNVKVGKRLGDRVAAYLMEMGYRVERLPDLRPRTEPQSWSENLLSDTPSSFDPASIDTKADLILDIRILRSGYLSTGGLNAYTPALSVEVVMYRRPGNEEARRFRMAYGTRPFWGESVMVPASESYHFGTYAKLVAQPWRVAEGLMAGSSLLAGRLVQEFPWSRKKR